MPEKIACQYLARDYAAQRDFSEPDTASCPYNSWIIYR